MGSGFNFFLNAIDVTPSTAGAWVDVDVSSYIPSGSTGVILKIVNTSAASTYGGEVRKNGSTDNFSLIVGASYTRYAFVGVDENRIFEAYIASTLVKIYLIGYCDENVGFFTNAIDKTPSTTGSWVDIDASANIPNDATGVICLLYNSGASNYYGGIRKNGSTDTFTYGIMASNRRYVYQLCGVDENRIFEGQIENTVMKIMLIGYTKSPITFFTNGIDKSITTTNTWVDIDVTAETESTADGAILFIKNTATSTTYKGDVRKNGSTDNHTANTKLYFTECRGAAIGMDSDQIFEGWIDNTAVKFYLIGYCKPAVAGQLITWSAPLKIGHVFTRPYRFLKLSQALQTLASWTLPVPTLLKQWFASLQTSHVFRRPFRYLKLQQALRTLANWTAILPTLKQWITSLNLTHTFRRPFRFMKLTQTLQASHVYIRNRLFKLFQTLNISHVFTRPFRRMGYMQQLQPTHVFRRPVRIIRFPAIIQLAHLFSRPTRFMKLIEQLTLGHAYFVAVPSVKKTKLFLVIGDLAIQLYGD